MAAPVEKLQRSMQAPLVDYVCVLRTESQHGEATPTAEVYPPPETDGRAPLPDSRQLCLFMLPEALVLKQTKAPSKPVTWSFALTGGVQLYGVTFTWYEAMVDDTSGKRVWAATGLCILSRWPFLSAFTSWLSVVAKHRADVAATEACIANLVHEVPLPPRGRAAVQLAVGKDISFSRPALNQHPVIVDTSSLEELLGLGAPTVVRLFHCLLTECKVLFTSREPHRLTPAIEAALATLFPFKWACTYIPFLPSEIDLDVLLDAPCPFVIGTTSAAVDSLDAAHAGVVVVDLDEKTLVVPPETASIPGGVASRLEDGLRRAVATAGPGAALQPFLEFFVDAIGDYERYMVADSGDGADGSLPQSPPDAPRVPVRVSSRRGLRAMSKPFTPSSSPPRAVLFSDSDSDGDTSCSSVVEVDDIGAALGSPLRSPAHRFSGLSPVEEDASTPSSDSSAPFGELVFDQDACCADKPELAGVLPDMMSTQMSAQFLTSRLNAASGDVLFFDTVADTGASSEDKAVPRSTVLALPPNEAWVATTPRVSVEHLEGYNPRPVPVLADDDAQVALHATMTSLKSTLRERYCAIAAKSFIPASLSVGAPAASRWEHKLLASAFPQPAPSPPPRSSPHRNPLRVRSRLHMSPAGVSTRRLAASPPPVKPVKGAASHVKKLQGRAAAAVGNGDKLTDTLCSLADACGSAGNAEAALRVYATLDGDQLVAGMRGSDTKVEAAATERLWHVTSHVVRALCLCGHVSSGLQVLDQERGKMQGDKDLLRKLKRLYAEETVTVGDRWLGVDLASASDTALVDTTEWVHHLSASRRLPQPEGQQGLNSRVVKAPTVAAFSDTFGESPAKAAGVAVGDVILAVDDGRHGHGVATYALSTGALTDVLRSSARPVKLTLLRKRSAVPMLLSVQTDVGGEVSSSRPPPAPRAAAARGDKRCAEPPQTPSRKLGSLFVALQPFDAGVPQVGSGLRTPQARQRRAASGGTDDLLLGSRPAARPTVDTVLPRGMSFTSVSTPLLSPCSTPLLRHGLQVDTRVGSACPACHQMHSASEVQQSLRQRSGRSSDYTTACLRCGSRYVARFQVRFSSAGKSTPGAWRAPSVWCEFLSVATLLKELENVLLNEGAAACGLKALREHHATLYYNVVLVLLDSGLDAPVDFLELPPANGMATPSMVTPSSVAAGFGDENDASPAAGRRPLVRRSSMSALFKKMTGKLKGMLA